MSRRTNGLPVPRALLRARAAERARHRPAPGPRLIDLLEPRVLMSVTYTGSQFTLVGAQLSYVDAANATQAVAIVDTSDVRLTASSAGAKFSVTNFAGGLTLTGTGGGDTFTIKAGTGAAAVTVATGAAGPGKVNALTLTAPDNVVANVTASDGSVAAAATTVSFPAAVQAVSVAGGTGVPGGGDALTVRGTSAAADAVTLTGTAVQLNGLAVGYSNFASLAVDGRGGDDAFTVNGGSVPTTLSAAAGGSASFTVNASNVPLTLAAAGAAGATTTFVLNGNAGPLTATGGAGTNAFVVNANSAVATLNGGGGTASNSFVVSGNSASLTVNAAGAANTVKVSSTSAPLTVNGSNSASAVDAFTVNAITAPVTVNAGAGTTSVRVTSPLQNVLSVAGGGVATTLTVDATVGPDVVTVNAAAVTGLDAPINYTGLTGLTVNGVGGNDQFVVLGTGAPTALNGGAGDHTFNVRADSHLVTIDAATGTSVVNVGSKQPAKNGKLDPIAGGVAVHGDGDEVLNLDDTGATTGRTGIVSELAVTGFGLGGPGVSYDGVATLNLNLGPAGNTVGVRGTAAGTQTNVNAGAGVNTIVVGTQAPATTGGRLNKVAGPLKITGSGVDSLTLDDSGNPAASTGALAGSTLTGLSPIPINWTGVSALTVNLGTAGDTFAINGTTPGTSVTVNGGGGADKLTVNATNGPVTVNSGEGDDTVAVVATSAATTVTTGGGHAKVVIGSAAPAIGGTLAGITGAVNVTGGGDTTLVIDDAGDAIGRAVTVAADAVSIAPTPAIAYASLAALQVLLGAGSDTLTVAGTAAGTETLIKAAGGDDAIAVRATGGPTTVDTGAGSHAVVVGSLAPAAGGVLADIDGELTILGNGADALTLDDSGNAAGGTGTLTDAGLTYAGTGGIKYSGVKTLTLNLGTGGDAFVIASTNAATTTTLNAGGGNDAVGVRATGGKTTVNTGDGVNAVVVGGNAPALGGAMTGLAAGLTVVGGGVDSLTVDDSGNASPAAGTLVPGQVSGLSPKPVDFTGVGSLDVRLGTGGKFIVVNTGPTTVTSVTGGGSGTIAVRATSSPTTILPAAGDDVVLGTLAPATGGTLAGIAEAVAVNGPGNLTIDGSGDSAARAVTVGGAATTIAGSLPVSYSGLAALSVLLGSGANAVTVAGTPAGAATTINTAGGNDTVAVAATGGSTTVNTGSGTNATTVGPVLSAINGLLTVAGNGTDVLTLNNNAAAVSGVGMLSATGLTGFGSGGVAYSGLKTLALNLGPAGDALIVAGTAAGVTTTITGGAGDDAINVQATGGTTIFNGSGGIDVVNVGSTSPALNGTLGGIAGPLTVTGGAETYLRLDDGGRATASASTLTATALSGLSPAAINFSKLRGLTLQLGAGPNAATVRGTGVGTMTSLQGGAGDDTVTFAAASGALPPAHAGTLVFSGNGGTDALTVDDSADATARAVTLSPGVLTGLGGSIGFGGLASLVLKLGSASDKLVVNDLAAGTATTVNGGGGTNTADLKFAADYAGGLTLANFASATLAVGGDLAGPLTLPALTSGTIAGNVTGSLSVAGKISALTIGGNVTGTIAAGSVGTITGTALRAGADSVVLGVTQAGVLRQVKAAAGVGGGPVTGMTFGVVYDGSTAADPQAAVLVNNPGGAANPLDLTLTSAKLTAKFNLSRLGSVGAVAGLKTVAVEGNLLAAITAAQKAAGAYPTGTAGGVVLPADDVLSVAARNDVRSGSIRTKSIMGVAFATLTDSAGTAAATGLTSQSRIMSVLAKNPSTGKAYSTILAPNGTLRAVVGESAAVVLFTDNTDDNDFDLPAFKLADQVGDGKTVTVLATVVGSKSQPAYASLLDFRGDGGSVDTARDVRNIVSTGPLGDLYLRAKTGVDNVTAPSVSGNVDLFGGAIRGTFQTTGVRTDPATGATSAVPADLGRVLLNSSKQATGVTTFKAGLAATGQLVSRGNLFSQVTIAGPLLGTIAAGGDVGVVRTNAAGSAVLDSTGRLYRYGGVVVASTTGVSTGQVLALGNILGDVTIAGTFAGRIAAKGAAVKGLAAARTGILGNVKLGAVAAAGAVISGGVVGDATGGATSLSATSLLGFVAAKGTVRTTGTALPAARVVKSAAGADAAAIDAVWTDAGLPLALDLAPLDLAGLARVRADAQALALTLGTLAGTTP